MSDKPPPQQTTIADAIGICLAISQRCLAEVRALARLPGPAGERGDVGARGEAGERGEKGARGEPGVPGKDGAQIAIRGTFNAEDDYRHLDVVMTGGSSFVALTDKPGECPGAGWQLLASAGRSGKPGLKGDRGEQGMRGLPGETPRIVEWTVDRTAFSATPVLSDGSTAPPLELRALFEQFQIETH